MISSIVSRIVILLFGTLYPAYASYKAVRTKNVKEYVKWMMYWIVFALFTCAETFTDVFFSWFPFYYEVKILMVIWLLSPATKGSSFLYRKFVHPALCKREQEIDEYISKAKDQGYHTVLNLGTKGVNYATNVIMQTAIKGGGGLVQQLRKSYSLSDLSMPDDRSDRSQQELDEVDDVVSMGDHRVVRRSVQGKMSRDARGTRTMSAPRMDMIFSEVDVDRHSSRSSNSRDSVNLSHIRSSEDISGPYPTEKSSSQDALTRTGSIGGASTRTRSKVVRSTFTSIKRPGAAEDEDVLIEEIEDDFSLPIPIENISLLSDGTVCLPNSNQMLIEYLRRLMEKDLQEKTLKPEKETKGNEYENYLKLKEKFESHTKSDKEEEKIDEETKQQPNDDKRLNSETADVANNEGKKHSDESENVTSLSDVVLSKSTDNEIISNAKDTNESKIVPKDTSETKFEPSVTEAAQISKSMDNLIPDLSVLVGSRSSEEIRSIGASSSTLSSDDELSEFATPNSSPKMRTKAKKMVKQKKRHAPPPPQIKEDNSKEKKKDETIKLENLETEPTINKELSSVDDKTKIFEKGEVKITDGAKEDDLHSSAKSGFKGVSSLSKLMHLPSKISFWSSPDDSNKKVTDAPKDNKPISNADLVVDCDTKPEDNVDHSKKTSLEMDEDLFHDAEKTINVENVAKSVDTNVLDYTFVPLTIAAISVNPESKSTDV